LSLIKFCISDNLKSINFEDAKTKVQQNGGIIRENVSRDCWYFVTNNPNMNSENAKRAKDLGVIFLDEKEFLEMLD
jgi:NAD-dependent DNA ligase